jgi:hypothetical protein
LLNSSATIPTRMLVMFIVHGIMFVQGVSQSPYS